MLDQALGIGGLSLLVLVSVRLGVALRSISRTERSTVDGDVLGLSDHDRI